MDSGCVKLVVIFYNVRVVEWNVYGLVNKIKKMIYFFEYFLEFKLVKKKFLFLLIV